MPELSAELVLEMARLAGLEISLERAGALIPALQPVFDGDDAGATEARRTAPYNLTGLPALSIMVLALKSSLWAFRSSHDPLRMPWRSPSAAHSRR